MSTIHDKEFGDITVRRSALARRISIKITPDGTLRASAPPYSPLLFIKKLLENSRVELRELLAQNTHTPIYNDGMELGRSHTLIVTAGTANDTIIACKQRELRVELSATHTIESPYVQQLIQAEYKKILRKEAKAYLPRRLMSLAKQHGFRYSKVRYSHAGGRWGSCSSAGTISLNIALMKLPLELIDYVLIHELCHTREMNHSQNFWALVEACHPEFKTHRKLLKQQHPYI